MEKYIIVITGLVVTAGTLALAYFITKEIIISAASKQQKKIKLPTGVVCVHEKKKDGVTHVSVEQNDKDYDKTFTKNLWSRTPKKINGSYPKLTDKYGTEIIEDITTDEEITVLYHANFELSPNQLTNLKNHGKR